MYFNTKICFWTRYTCYEYTTWTVTSRIIKGTGKFQSNNDNKDGEFI